MRKILIVGAGQSGLQLALCLQENGYDVTVMSARTPEEIREGWITSTQCMFFSALRLEREHGLNLWEDVAVKNEGQGLSVAGPDGDRILNWISPWDDFAQSIDQRVKMAAWLELFESRGGNVIIHGVTTADLDGLGKFYDLVLVAAGKGELVQLFDRNPEHSPYTVPQRHLAVTYTHGLELRPESPVPGVWMNYIPGVCEMIMIPGYTLSGNCDIVYLSIHPDGPADRFGDRPKPQEQLNRTLDIMREFIPWEYERARKVELTDSRGTLLGGYAPVVRHPVGELPSGTPVLGMADVVVANDPITGQGANNAAKCADSYLHSILAHGDEPFGRSWMRSTFNTYWEHAQHVTRWTNAMLQPPPPHALEIFGAAQANPEVARRFVNGFNDPSDFQHWFLDPQKATDYLATFSS